MGKLISHEFYCIHCGKRGLDCLRKDGQMRGKGHLKNLYCIHCRKTTRHYEIYDSADKTIFIEKFNNGGFVNEIKDDKAACGVSRVWENFLRS